MTKLATIRLWVLIMVAAFDPLPALAQPPAIPTNEMNDCRISAANTAIKINPAYQVKSVSIAKPDKPFHEKDEFGKPLDGWQFIGEMNVAIGDMTGRHYFGCTFVNIDKAGWTFSWAGLRHRKF
jgi:hypothetical protein